MAIEDEYTITAPKVSSSSAAQRTPLSYSAAGARPGLMLRSTQPPFHREAKYLAAMLIVAEHVEARARGREQHGVARARRLARERHRPLHRVRAQDRDIRAGHRRFDQRGIASDEHERARGARDRALQRREILSLAFAARDEDHFRAAPRSPGSRSAARKWSRRWCPWNRRTSARLALRRPARRDAA